MSLPRRRVLQAFGCLAATVGAALAAPAVAVAEPAGQSLRNWKQAAQEVRGEFLWAWRNYAQRALGADQIRPISGGTEDFFVPGHPVGLSAVEAVDTLWLMGADDEVGQAIDWIKGNLRFDIDAPFQLFETNIRMVGGLASAYHCTGDQRLLDLTVDLANRLLPAFSASPLGLPYRFVNLATGEVSGPQTNIVEVGTYIAEFGMLSEWTGDSRYFDVSKQAMRAVYDRRTKLGLLPHDLDARTGDWLNRAATVGPAGDSYYEYLWDAFDLFGDQEIRQWYDTLTSAILEHQAEVYDGRLWFPQVDAFNGKVLDRNQSELAAFYAGLLGQSGHVVQGRAYHDSFNAVQDQYGVIPGDVFYPNMSVTSPNNELRPEFADSALMLWLVTGDEIFRERAYTHFRNMVETSKTNYGFANLADVTTKPPKQSDSCPGYWWSEQMKYYWLLFSDTPRFDYRNNYLSTEGNLLRGAIR